MTLVGEVKVGMTISFPEFKGGNPTGDTITGWVKSIEPVVSLSGGVWVTLNGDLKESFSDDDEVMVIEDGDHHLNIMRAAPCIGSPCEGIVEYEGSIAFDETAVSCIEHRNHPDFIDGVTWRLGGSAYIPSLDGGEANGFGPDLGEKPGFLAPWCKHCGEPLVEPTELGAARPYFDTAEGEDDPACKPGFKHYVVYIWTASEGR